MANFEPFSKAVKAQFAEMSESTLYTTVDADELWLAYLAAFPEGQNPIYKERTEHDCTCCKQFIRNIGNAVALDGDRVVSVWDVKGLEYPYDLVAEELSKLVREAPIKSLFKRCERGYGAPVSRQMLADGLVKDWNHFHGVIADKHFSINVASDVGAFNTTVAVFKRGLTELSIAAVKDVIGLIEDNLLYRGAEFLAAVKGFSSLLNDYWHLQNDSDRDRWVWLNATSPHARFRASLIGSLVEDLSNGKNLDGAVASYEAKVAPANYKRPTALITPRMIKEAMGMIETLGLESALQRRFAKLSDVSVNNVLWADRSVTGKMKGGLEGLLLSAVPPQKAAPTNVQDISVADFMARVVPSALSMEVMVEAEHTSKFMSLTAPVNEDSKRLFKWNNDFAWSYDGNITDSAIKERVKAAGGNVTTARLRVSLSWFNYDDLDIHALTPDGNRIYFGQKMGVLDVDMNAGIGRTRVPVENLSWVNLRDGVYSIAVNQFARRETSNPGFVLEVEANGQTLQYKYVRAVSGEIEALRINVMNGVILSITAGGGVEAMGALKVNKWGVSTGTLVKVNTLMKSPNHWDGNVVGNKHWFFMLDGCKNDQPTRGIYNEFLNGDLERHRKVFEVLGEKTKCPVVDEQLSGLGFSSTNHDSVVVSVTAPNNGRRFYKVVF